jgi:hypothetical protein
VNKRIKNPGIFAGVFDLSGEGYFDVLSGHRSMLVFAGRSVWHPGEKVGAAKAAFCHVEFA